MSDDDVARYRGTSPSGQHWLLEVLIDSDPESPRDSKENLGTLIYSHRRYTLGDERISQGSMDEYLAAKGIDPTEMVSLPVYLLDHSGLALSTRDFGDPWDSGCVGAIYATFDDIDSHYGNHTPETLEKVYDALRHEVAEMDAYLSGESYGMRLVQVRGPEDSPEQDVPVDDEATEEMWGFLGNDPRLNGMLSQCSAEAALALAPALEVAHGRQQNPIAPDSAEAPSSPRAQRPR